MIRRHEKLDRVSRKSKFADPLRPVGLGRPEPVPRRPPGPDRLQHRRAREPALALDQIKALFAGSDGSGWRWAVIASLIETCKLVGVEPHAHLTDVITDVVEGYPQCRLEDLLPWAYSGP